MPLPSLVRHGFPPAKIPVPPGIQLPAKTGTQGWGVKTPRAAAVAEATWGFPREEHMPQVLMVVSPMVATGFPSPNIVFCEVTVRLAGAVPKVHITLAPVVTITPILLPLSGEEETVPLLTFR